VQFVIILCYGAICDVTTSMFDLESDFGDVMDEILFCYCLPLKIIIVSRTIGSGVLVVRA